MENIKHDSQYFTVIELAEGVYAAIEKEKNTGSNAGFIDLGNYTVIFDTFLNVDASLELKRISEELTGKEAGFVINSHSHTDHIVGNYIYPDKTKLISSNKVREILIEVEKEFELEKGQYRARIEEIEKCINDKKGIELDDLNNELLFLRNLVKPGIRIRVPDLTTEKEMMLHGSKRSLHLFTYESAHSAGDMIAYLPEDKICFMGDLLFAESHPWLGSGNPEKFINILEEISNYDIKHFVPGHGRLSSKDDVLLQIQYINEILQLVKTKKSVDENDYSIDELSPIFRDWRSLCFSWNIKSLIERFKNN